MRTRSSWKQDIENSVANLTSVSLDSLITKIRAEARIATLKEAVDQLRKQLPPKAKVADAEDLLEELTRRQAPSAW